MRAKLLIFFAILILGAGYGVWDTYAPPNATLIAVTPSQPSDEFDIVADVTFVDLNGTPHNLHNYKGKTILINFWATWCPPCVAEFPDLLALAAQYPDDMMLIAVSVDKNKATINRFYTQLPEEAQQRLSLKNVLIAHDPQQKITRDTFKIYRYPETLILNPDLKIAKKVVGVVDTRDSALHDLIKSAKNQ